MRACLNVPEDEDVQGAALNQAFPVDLQSSVWRLVALIVRRLTFSGWLRGWGSSQFVLVFGCSVVIYGDGWSRESCCSKPRIHVRYFEHKESAGDSSDQRQNQRNLTGLALQLGDRARARARGTLGGSGSCGRAALRNSEGAWLPRTSLGLRRNVHANHQRNFWNAAASTLRVLGIRCFPG